MFNYIGSTLCKFSSTPEVSGPGAEGAEEASGAALQDGSIWEEGDASDESCKASSALLAPSACIIYEEVAAVASLAAVSFGSSAGM